MALFDLPYQWIFPVVFITMTAIIAYCFMKYVILADDEDDEEAKGEQVNKGGQAASTQASVQASEQSEEKNSK